MLRLTASFLAFALATTAAAQGPDADTPAAENAELNAALPPAQAAMKSHVMFLASDAMRGREAGSPEYDIAAQYVASQFYEQGLRPAGDAGSYLQRVPLLSYHPDGTGTFTLAVKGAAPVTLEFGKDYVPSGDPSSDATSLSAPIVFVGQGIFAPHLKRNDYAGVDVKGKIVAFVGGAPMAWDPEERAHFASPRTKLVEASKRGAVGVVTLAPPERPLAPLARSIDHPSVIWTRADGTVPDRGAVQLGTLGGDTVSQLLAAAGTSSEGVTKAIADGTFKPIVFPATLSVALKTKRTRIESSNVAGLLPGTDPKLKDEVVVLSAHLDHVGVGRPDAKGDTIYNGAMDNAVGIASLIEEARRFKESGKAPRRSILFLAVTAEEKGLVGSDYFANNPTLPKSNLVADVNLDMPVITFKFEDIIVFGAHRSTLGAIVDRAAAGIGVTVSPDPMPEQGLFVRSDHYRFVQQGIPSVFLWPGHGGPGKAAYDTFFAEHYHQPSDEVVQGPAIDWESGVRFVDVNYAIARAIADGDQRPLWKKGDFFGTLYGGPGAK